MKSLRVAFFGLSFKPNIDDLRESPAIEVVNQFLSNYPDINVEVVEPNVNDLDKAGLVKSDEGDLYKLVSLNKALSADVGVVLVAHDEFKNVPELNSGKFLNVVW